MTTTTTTNHSDDDSSPTLPFTRHEPLGLELTRLPQTSAEWQQIPALLHQHGRGVLILSNLDVTAVELETAVLQPLARVLGQHLVPYDRWPGQSPGVANCPHLALLGNYKARTANDVVQTARPGDAIAEYKPATLDISEWHTDGSFLALPKSYICLYAPANVEHALPQEGGETRFCSTRVPDEWIHDSSDKNYTKEWASVHSWETFMRFLEQRDPKRPKVTDTDIAKKPDQTWPLFRRNPHTGAWHYYINPKNTKAVYNAAEKTVDDPTQLIHDLAQRLQDHHGVYWHKWQPGQLVVWQNQEAVLHAATPFDATRYERLLYRAEMAAYHVPCTPQSVVWGYLHAQRLPVATVPSGAIVVVDTVSGGMVDPPPTAKRVPAVLQDIKNQVHDRVGPHILTGPIAIQDAQPGDVLQIDILDVKLTSDWAYTLHKKSGELRHTHLSVNGCWAQTPWGSRVDCAPFFGVLGVAPPGQERVSSVPPSSTYGGNLDLKKLVPGSTLYIPVHHAGALLFVGDGHARQGDGECCGTALETALTGTFRLTVHKQQESSASAANVQTKVVRAETTTEMIGIGVEDTVDAAVDAALANLVAWIQQVSPGLSTVDAECLCSIAADISVTQIVNTPTKGAHVTLQKCHLPPSGFCQECNEKTS